MLTVRRAVLVAVASLFLHVAAADTVRVMATGLGEGSVTGAGINCGAVSGTIDCDETLAPTDSITLTAAALPGSTFAGWGGDCPDMDPATPANQCLIALSSFRSVRARFDRATAIVPLTDTQIADITTTRSGIGDYLAAHPSVDTVAEFIAALPVAYRQNWMLMPRSESLQTGNARHPRLLLSSPDATLVFAISLRGTHDPSFPAGHRHAIEFMQWDAAQKNFRFHEIVLAPIPGRDDTNPDPALFVPRFPAQARGFNIDDSKCFACHATRNVLNRGLRAGTDGVLRDVPVKMKPNWDAYDSWGGMLPFNRDRIYKGSVEAAAFRTLLNPWTWRSEPDARAVIEQLELQPPNVPDGAATRPRTHGQDYGGSVLNVIIDDRIVRLTAGGPDDGRIVFGFDAPGLPTTTEPQPSGTATNVTYAFDRRAGTAGTPVLRDPSTSATDTFPYTQFVTLHHPSSPRSDAGRGVQFMSRLGDDLNSIRVADEIKTHRYATGSVAFDVRPLALAIAAGCITVPEATDIPVTQTVSPALTPAAQAFFDARNGMNFNNVFDDTRRRQFSMTLRKVDIQRLTLDRAADLYVFDENGPSLPPVAPEAVNGLILQHGAGTSGIAGGTGGLDTSLARLRQEIFRRPVDRGAPDATVMGGIFVDRENYTDDVVKKLALFRYFLEPMGVAVDKWSMNVRGRSRTYTFAANGMMSIVNAIQVSEPGSIRDSLGIPPLAMTTPAPSTTEVCPAVMPMVTASLATLPAPVAVPTYTDVQRIFNKSCIECHGGLGYPPFRNFGGIAQSFNLAEDETPGANRFARSHAVALSLVGATPATSLLYQRVTDNGVLAHPYNPGQPFNLANPDDPMAPDVADERCREGIMPCDGPPLSKVDIETIRRWIVGGAANTEGDPHIRTVDGVHYDFQAAGEFTLLRDAVFELQTRQTPVPSAAPITDAHTGLTSCVSINSAVAMRVGKHRITYQPDLSREGGVPGPMVLRIDGKAAFETGTADPVMLPGGGRVLKTSVPGGVQVQAPGGTVVVVTPGVWLGVTYLNVNVTQARATEGIMGTVAPGNWLPALPDGRLLGAKPADAVQRHEALYTTFANAWRVNDETSLFDYEAGLSSRSFVAAKWPEAQPQSCNAPRLPGVPVAQAPAAPLPAGEAERLCARVADPARKRNCIADVTATRAPVFAETYLATERLLNRPRPQAPELRLPQNNAVILAGSARFEWTKPVDPLAQGLTFRHCLWDSAQLFDLNACKVIEAGWSPQGQNWLLHIVLGLLGLIVAVALWFVAGARWMLGILVALAVSAWAVLDHAMTQAGRGVGTHAIEGLDPDKTYRWKVIVEDAEGNIVESQTRRVRTKR